MSNLWQAALKFVMNRGQAAGHRFDTPAQDAPFSFHSNAAKREKKKIIFLSEIAACCSVCLDCNRLPGPSFFFFLK